MGARGRRAHADDEAQAQADRREVRQGDRGALQLSDPRVDDYAEGLPPWQREICRQVREIVREADPEIEETVKRRVQPYFVLNGNVCALLATKDHVNVFLYDPTVSDPEGIITAGHENKTGRQIAIYEGEPINRRALTAMLREIAEHNRGGGWRRLTGAR